MFTLMEENAALRTELETLRLRLDLSTEGAALEGAGMGP